MALGRGRRQAPLGTRPHRGLFLFAVVIGLTLAACQADGAQPADGAPTSPTSSVAESDTGSTTGQTPAPDTTIGATDETQSTAGVGRDETHPDCPIPNGSPLMSGPSVEMVDLGEVDGVRVEGAIYPHPPYEGSPWSHWGQGLAIEDGRFFSGIGDHIGPDGNSYIYEYDPESSELTMVADILSYVDHEPGSWGYGKIHGQMVRGACGEIYLSTYWGTARDLVFSGSYRGDYLMRLDPYGRTLQALDVPIDLHGIPSLAGAPPLGLVFGEAVDPIARAAGEEDGPFFVYDVEAEEVIYEDSEGHVGYRNIMVDQRNRAFFALGNGRLAMYDPETNAVGRHPHDLPGDWLRASTAPAPDGRIYGVTRDPDRFFVMEPTGEINDLGEAAGYTTSMALSADGEHFYYMPRAHGYSAELGTPLIRVDGTTGEQEVVVELNPLVEEGLGYTAGGSYSTALSPDGQTVYLVVNVGVLGDEAGFAEVALLVVHLP